MMKKLNLVVVLIFIALSAFPQDYALRARVMGDGDQDLIFLPGFGCSGEQWHEIARKLEDRYRCHLITLPGFNGVPAVEEPMYQKIMQDLHFYLETKQIRNAVAIGHSMGGHLALYLEAAYPGTFSKIVVVDALPFLAAANDPGVNEETTGVNPESTARLYKAIAGEQFETLITESAESMVNDQSKVPYIVAWAMNSDPYAYGYVYGEFINLDLRQEMSSIACPVLLLIANGYEKDEALKIWKRQYRGLKHKTFRYNGHANHYIMYDDPEWLLRQVEEFLNGK